MTYEITKNKIILGSSIAGIASTPIAVAVISGSVNILFVSIIIELLIVITTVLVYILLNQFARGYGGYRSISFLDQNNRTRLDYIIDQAEERAGVRLSWGAHEMLIIPVLESIESKGHVEWNDVERSIHVLVDTMAEFQDSSDVNQGERYPQRRKRNSISLIKGLYQNFCNIPPFCSERPNY